MQNRCSHALVLLASLSASHASAQGFDSEVPSLGTYGNPRAIASGDLDGDGHPDLVVAGGFGATVSWHANRGDGTFQPQLPVVQDGSQTPKTDVVPVDLDADGDDDLLVRGDGATGVRWIESLGGGEFSGERTLASSFGEVQDILAGDLDSDGQLDIIAYEPAVGLAWFRSLGGGAYDAPQLLSIAAGDISNVVAADLDADGDTDLVVAKRSGDRIQWIEQTGPATFAPIRTLTQNIGRPEMLEVTDVDGDGALDLVAANLQGRELAWVRNLGGLAFGPKQVIYPGFENVELYSMDDVDGDGLTDVLLLIFGTDRLTWFRNIGGAFAAPVDLPVDGFLVYEFAAIDADGDGDLDLASANAFDIEIVERTAAGFQNLGRVSVDIGFGVQTLPAASADIDGDGLSDLIVADSISSSSYLWLRNEGAGVWSSIVQEFPQDLVMTIDALDIDADGDVDVVTTGNFNGRNSIIVTLNNGGGLLGNPVVVHLQQADTPVSVTFGDAEADGDLDLLWTQGAQFTAGNTVEHGWVLQTAPGVFGSGPFVADDSFGYGNQLGDFDADGDADIVYVRSGDTQPTWRENDGMGGFGPEQTVGGAAIHVLSMVRTADLDSDGRDDVVAIGSIGVTWFRATGGGFAGPMTLDSANGASQLLLRDLDRDGQVDVLLSGGGAPSRYLRNLGAGSFVGPAGLPASSIGSRVIDVADYDGDLDLDVLKRPVLGGYSWNTNLDRFGDAYCGPAEENSTGAWAAMSASGSTSVVDNDVTLIAERLPVGSFGYFLVAPADGFTPLAGGSSGNLCVGGAVGRLNRNAGEIFQAPSSGVVDVPLDLTDVPTPTGATALAPGDTRYFQAWFRDANPGVTSNLTNGLRIEFD